MLVKIVRQSVISGGEGKATSLTSSHYPFIITVLTKDICIQYILVVSSFLSQSHLQLLSLE